MNHIETDIFDVIHQSKLYKGECKMNQVIEIEETMLSIHVILPCANCGTWTKHVLSKSKEFYACSCGEIIDIEIKENEDEHHSK